MSLYWIKSKHCRDPGDVAKQQAASNGQASYLQPQMQQDKVRRRCAWRGQPSRAAVRGRPGWERKVLQSHPGQWTEKRSCCWIHVLPAPRPSIPLWLLPPSHTLDIQKKHTLWGKDTALQVGVAAAVPNCSWQGWHLQEAGDDMAACLTSLPSEGFTLYHSPAWHGRGKQRVFLHLPSGEMDWHDGQKEGLLHIVQNQRVAFLATRHRDGYECGCLSRSRVYQQFPITPRQMLPWDSGRDAGRERHPQGLILQGSSCVLVAKLLSSSV